jgi:PA-IL-like protein
MVRRIAAATVGMLCFVMVGLAAADVTFVLNSGERQSGQLVYHTGTNIGLIQNGNERTFPVSDVAVILYNDGDPSNNELDQLPTSDNPPELERHTLVLRNGRVLHGKVYHWNSDSVLFDTTSGRGTYNNNDVARLYLSGPPARRVFSGGNNQPVAGNNGNGRGFGRGRGNAQPALTIRVEANRPWTDTGLIVQPGERITFNTSGTIEFGRGMNTGPDGDKGMPARAGYPVREMPVGGLIARVGNGAPFAIGSTGSPVTMPVGGRLFLGVNDDDYRDNVGGFDVNLYRR